MPTIEKTDDGVLLGVTQEEGQFLFDLVGYSVTGSSDSRRRIGDKFYDTLHDYGFQNFRERDVKQDCRGTVYFLSEDEMKLGSRWMRFCDVENQHLILFSAGHKYCWNCGDNLRTKNNESSSNKR